MSDSTIAVAARGIVKRFGGVTALDGVDLDVPQGAVTCLAGENGCGKSTLIKIIMGVESPDAGAIDLAGRTQPRMSVPAAVRGGVQVIYQDLSLFPNLSAAENIAMSARIVEGRRLVDARNARRQAADVVARLGVDLPLDVDVADLPIAERQLVAIGRALAAGARVIFMDEPTTALTVHEVDKLFGVVRTLTEQGVGIVFVSHKLEEVFEISDYVTVLRGGKVTASGPAGDFTQGALIRAMTGRDVVVTRHANPVPPDAATVLRVEGLTLTGAFEDVRFDVRAGEILGLTGLLGSGRQEIAEAIFGLLSPTAGRIEVDGEPIRTGSTRHAIDAGIGYVPADRLTQGLFLDQPIWANIAAASLDKLTTRAGRLRSARLRELVDRLIGQLSIKVASAQAPARSLSGGNQQRVVLAKWLARTPRVLVLNMPTVGVDVGSKDEILAILREQASAGMAIVVISDDVLELVACCHRVISVRRGRLAAELDGDDVNPERVRQELAR